MRKTLTAAVMVAATSLCGFTVNPATAKDRLITPQPGMVFSATSPAVGDCPSLSWYFKVGPNHTLTGIISHNDTDDVWRAKGTYTPEHTFHIDTQEMGGQGRTGSVDGQVLQDGSLNMKVGNVVGGSTCADKQIYIRWFRDGNAYSRSGGVAG